MIRAAIFWSCIAASMLLACRPSAPPPQPDPPPSVVQQASVVAPDPEPVADDAVATVGGREAVPAIAPEPEIPPLKVKLGAFQKECEANAVAAEMKYLNKYIEFNGYLHDLSTTWTESGSLDVDATKEHQFLQSFVCSMRPGQREQAAKLRKGQKVKLRCKCVHTLGGISGDDCLILD